MTRSFVVLNTRPREQAKALSDQLRALGMEPLEAPAIEIVPTWDNQEVASAVRALRSGTIDWLVVPSANAGRHLLTALRASGSGEHDLAGVQVLCGTETARALARMGIRATRVLDAFSAVAALRLLRQEKGTRQQLVLVPRSAQGRDELVQGLQDEGTSVVDLAVYETRASDPRDLESMAAALSEGWISAVALTSPLGAASVVQALKAHGHEPVHVLSEIPVLACIGDTTARALADAGVGQSNTVVAERPSMRSIAEAIDGALRSWGQDGQAAFGRDVARAGAGRAALPRLVGQPTPGATLVVVGVSHHTAPVSMRERLSISEEAWYGNPRGVVPSVLVSTCNRAEVYTWTSTPEIASARVLEALGEMAEIQPAQLESLAYWKVGVEAFEHLVRVTAGLDSLVLGEGEIAGQVSTAHQSARQSPAGTSPDLDAAFRQAIEAARRVRRSTTLSRHPSLAAAAVNLALVERREGGAENFGQTAVVLGAGVVARTAARALLDGGMRVVLCNRTPQHAGEVAAQLGEGVQVVEMAQLPRLLAEPGVGILVGATASRAAVVGIEEVAGAMLARQGAPLTLLDLAVPRDFEPTVRSVAGVHLIDLDDLAEHCPADRETREAETARANAMAREEAERIETRLRMRAAGPAIVALRERAEAIRLQELQRSANRLSGLTPAQRREVERMTRGIVAKLMHGPTVALREAALQGGGTSLEGTDLLRLAAGDRNDIRGGACRT